MVDTIGQPARQSTSSTTSTLDNHRMRITSGGSISSYVQFALGFLSENPRIPLVLHTLPPAHTTPENGGQTSSDPKNPVAGPSQSTSTLTGCTLTTPKLISIVEIIKREYIVLLQKDLQRQQSASKVVGNADSSANGKAKGKGKEVKRVSLSGRGLWQYTESGLWRPPSNTVNSGWRDLDLTRVLEGRTKPKMTHHPYLEITLSTRPLPLEEKHNVTGQYVTVKRKSRARGRGKSGAKPVEHGSDAPLGSRNEGMDLDERADNDRGQAGGRSGAVAEGKAKAASETIGITGEKRKSKSTESGRDAKRKRVVDIKMKRVS